jgi:hypothetical protein
MINRGVVGCQLALHFIEGEAFQGKERPDHILSQPLGLCLGLGPDPAVD